MGYLCANFSLPGPLGSRVMPDVRERRQTKASLNAPRPRLLGAGAQQLKSVLAEVCVLQVILICLWFRRWWLPGLDLRPRRGVRYVLLVCA